MQKSMARAIAANTENAADIMAQSMQQAVSYLQHPNEPTVDYTFADGSRLTVRDREVHVHDELSAEDLSLDATSSDADDPSP